MRAAWEALPEEEQSRLEGLSAVHDYRYSQGLVGGLDFLSDEEWKALPPVQHPIVRTHPETGRRNLYIGRHASHIIGMDVERGRAWLQRLLDEACRPPRVFSHCWTAGDVVVWDNRCVLHRGRPWSADAARVMHRTTIAGDGANDWAL
jgi:alpha-ketoglutarate-dependent 2,4-dichlorophenoxyacetate dioxygenase